MKTTMIITAVLTGLLIFSTVVCGLWIKYSPEVEDLASSVNFHMLMGVLTAVASVVSVVIGLIAVNKLG